MTDRVVEFPQRYLLVPVTGEDGQYDLYPVTGTVTAAGTQLIKANLLTDATAAALGLSGDPTVNTAFSAIATLISNIQGDISVLQQPTTAIGTYTGNGMAGSANKNSLSFTFTPKIILISHEPIYTPNPVTYTSYIMVMFQGLTTAWAVVMGGDSLVSSGYSFRNVVAWSENGVEWYSPDGTGSTYAPYQMNNNGTTYYYAAIG